MKTFLFIGAALLLSVSLSGFKEQNKKKGWIPLFDGKSLANWKVGEHPGTFTVTNEGTIMVFGERAHLFYDGPVMDHNFRNFEFKATVMTTPGANSGIYIHTPIRKKVGLQPDMKYR